MATPITPTPRQGSWVKMDPHVSPWTPQPRQGSWVCMDPLIIKVRVKVDGMFGWSEVSIKTDGEFVPGELEEML